MFSKGLTSQVNRESAEFDNILMKLDQGSDTSREHRYQILKSLDFGRVKWQNPGTSGASRTFPTSLGASIQEVTVKMKEIQSTVSFDWNLYDRILKTPLKYASNIDIEVQAALDVNKIELCRRLFGDGTGVLAELHASTVPTISTGVMTVTVASLTGSKGFIGWVQPSDIIQFAAADGTLHYATTSAPANIPYYLVTEVNREANTLKVTGLNSSLAAATINAVGTVAVGDMIYSYNQGTIANVGSVSDYGVATEIMAGLASWSEDDGRTLFGVTMAGALGGTRHDNAAATLDTDAIEALMNKGALKVGDSKYKYNQMLMGHEVHSAFIDANEADRRFIDAVDPKRGSKGFAYKYRNQELMCVNSRFVPLQRVYFIPASAAAGEHGESGYAVEFRGTQFEQIKLGSTDQWFKPGSSGNTQQVEQYFNAYASILGKQPGAILCLENFSY